MSDIPENIPPMTRYRGVVPSTGEVIDIDAPATRARRRNSRRKIFALVDLEAMNLLELTGREWSILHAIMRAMDPETNESRISLVEISESLGIAASAVSRAMNVLRARRIVFTLRRSVHRVNSHIAFRGSNQDWDMATDTERLPLWKR